MSYNQYVESGMCAMYSNVIWLRVVKFSLLKLIGV